MKESAFQAALIKRIYETFGSNQCVVLKNDPNYIQGFPDLTILFMDGRWAVLEVKASRMAPRRPNQNYYVHALTGKGFAAFVYPENVEEIIYALQETFGT